MMKQYVLEHEWELTEDGFHPETNEIYESLLSIGNGHMGGRANFEEDFSGNTLQGTYVGGIYYPDKTRVGWWKNGYPEYFAKVLNATNFIGIRIEIDGDLVDLAKVNIIDFKRSTNMKNGLLSKKIIFETSKGKRFTIHSERFFSLSDPELACISYKLTSENSASIKITPYLDGNIKNQDANYDELFWESISSEATKYQSSLTMKTLKTDFVVSVASSYSWSSEFWISDFNVIEKNKFTATEFCGSLNKGESVHLTKYINVSTSRDYDTNDVTKKASSNLNFHNKDSFESLFLKSEAKWKSHWDHCDIKIEGDSSAQQGIRFNIFHLNQTYTGIDSRLNIGPKGFTGEKYGGSTYWDTEAYCLPFYLGTSDESISKNLLLYRYNQLDKAIENASKLGLAGALYPMVTMNGEECHNEWEITFEEIHRNAAISYAIFNYVRYTGDESYLASNGFEVLAQISRFWADRVNYNPYKDVYMLLGVTGPNEYDNNINNNWYTNRMAKWNLEYTLEVLSLLEHKYPKDHSRLMSKLNITDKELKTWNVIINKMYLPEDKDMGIFLQQDGYLDKEQILVEDLDAKHLPLNQNWSWDRILRSCFIKQADVLQGLFFLYDQYDLDVKKKNFDFYEPRTVHESSLSPCVHSIIASELGYEDKAYELYLRTARLDLDNYNNDTEDGLHITSMAGTWMSVVYGFGGFKIIDDKLSLNPFIPKAWTNYTFKLNFRSRILSVGVRHDGVHLELIDGLPLDLLINSKSYTLSSSMFIKSN